MQAARMAGQQGRAGTAPAHNTDLLSAALTFCTLCSKVWNLKRFWRFGLGASSSLSLSLSILNESWIVSGQPTLLRRPAERHASRRSVVGGTRALCRSL